MIRHESLSKNKYKTQPIVFKTRRGYNESRSRFGNNMYQVCVLRI
jgi:hypothetical protein